ncbi:hypothetical protein [Streptomyces sp. YU58]|uniref:hypothetical protein n=1 Tax=Streptomyces sp. SX92 TaxID=3158972 RepID=UPI0027B8E0F4|nr:hypothetical protein [Streptomyces coralus]WLW50220.1 hypothetical protein QU709_02085 [Streptomyces coralus]
MGPVTGEQSDGVGASDSRAGSGDTDATPDAAASAAACGPVSRAMKVEGESVKVSLSRTA